VILLVKWKSKKSIKEKGKSSKEKNKLENKQNRKVTAEDLLLYDGVTIVAGLKNGNYLTYDTSELVAVVLGALDNVIIEMISGRIGVGYAFGELVTLFVEERMKELAGEVDSVEEKEYLQ